MEHEIAFKDSIFEVKAYGSASPKGLMELFEAIRMHADWSPGGRVLVDFRQLTDFNTNKMDFSSLSAVASYIRKHASSFGKMKVVSLLRDTMDSKVVSGLLNSLHKFYGTEIEHDIFTELESALQWLKSN